MRTGNTDQPAIEETDGLGGLQAGLARRRPELNTRIHDGVPLEKLAARAGDWRDTFFELLFPYARPTAGSRVLELGPGVGWIMESMLVAYPIEEIVVVYVSLVNDRATHATMATSVVRDLCAGTVRAARAARRRLL